MKNLLVDFRISKTSEKTLLELGYNIVKTTKCDNLQDAVSGHPDMLVCRLSEKDFVAERTFYSIINPYFLKYNLIAGESKLNRDYPFDIAFNSARVGNYLICNEKYTDRKIIEYCFENNLKILNTKQGYTKCSICIVSENAIITADKGIYKLAADNKIDALLISNKGIVLNGYNEGFFGGATGLLEKNLLAINGNAKLLADYDDIRAFCSNYGVDIISLSDEAIQDIGTIIRL